MRYSLYLTPTTVATPTALRCHSTARTCRTCRTVTADVNIVALADAKPPARIPSDVYVADSLTAVTGARSRWASLPELQMGNLCAPWAT